MSWKEFYPQPHSLETFFEQLEIHSEFTAGIMKEHPSKLLEVGAGRGTLLAFFSLAGIKCAGLDSDASVIDRYREFVKNLHIGDNILLGDAFKLPFGNKSFDVSVSQGFFEHFSDKEIHALLDEQLRTAKKVFFSVPSKYYRIKDFGNERLMTMGAWKSLLDGYVISGAVPYFYKRLKKNLLFRLPLMYYFVITGKKK